VQDWRDERIAELETAAAERDARLAERETQLAERETQLAERETQLAERETRIAELERRIADLSAALEELRRKLGQNSQNSHRPPSSDSPTARGQRRSKGKSKSQRKRGGQPGHRGSHRRLLPADEVDKVVDLFPSNCGDCGKPLPEVPDPQAKRYQVTEFPRVEAHTTEFRRHTVGCSCGRRTCADYDTIPESPFGPRLMALIALLTGVYHLSRRRACDLLNDVIGVRLSVGAVSAVEARVSTAVQPAVDAAWERVQAADVKHTDGTSWFQSGLSRALWTIATAAATVFKIVADGSKQTLQPLYGVLQGILVSDRAKALNFWAMEQRQICWAHLLRKFVSFAERDGPAGALGRELLDYTGLVFEYWHDYRDGKLNRERFVAWMVPVRRQLEAALQRAVDAKLGHVSGSCADILTHVGALWTFVERDGVDPTNNHAERELRAFVLWRRRSFGTQSDRGNLFAERVMTVAHTARKQRRHVLTFLTDCCRALLDYTPPPSLFETPTISR
jgi:transposase